MNEEKKQEFINKYNELCKEYGMQIVPQMQLLVTEVTSEVTGTEPQGENIAE